MPELERFTEGALQQTGVPGTAVAVVFRDEVVYLQGFGVRKAGSAEPVTADTVFQLASMSKPIASSVIAALVGDGVVTWDDRVSALDPEFRLSDPWLSSEVTLRDLLRTEAAFMAARATTLRSWVSHETRSCRACAIWSRPDRFAPATLTAILE